MNRKLIINFITAGTSVAIPLSISASCKNKEQQKVNFEAANANMSIAFKNSNTKTFDSVTNAEISNSNNYLINNIVEGFEFIFHSAKKLADKIEVKYELKFNDKKSKIFVKSIEKSQFKILDSNDTEKKMDFSNIVRKISYVNQEKKVFNLINDQELLKPENFVPDIKNGFEFIFHSAKKLADKIEVEYSIKSKTDLIESKKMVISIEKSNFMPEKEFLNNLAKKIEIKYQNSSNITFWNATKNPDSIKNNIVFTGLEENYQISNENISKTNDKIKVSFKLKNQLLGESDLVTKTIDSTEFMKKSNEEIKSEILKFDSKIDIKLDFKKVDRWSKIDQISKDNINFVVDDNTKNSITDLVFIDKEIINNQIFAKYSFIYEGEKFESKLLIARKLDFKKYSDKILITQIEKFRFGGALPLKAKIIDSNSTFNSLITDINPNSKSPEKTNLLKIKFYNENNGLLNSTAVKPFVQKINDKEFYIYIAQFEKFKGYPFIELQGESPSSFNLDGISWAQAGREIKYDDKDIYELNKKTGEYKLKITDNVAIAPITDLNPINFGSIVKSK
ncbi:hypothetical protein [Mycoplasma zalophidermidis]|uniref:hypothetical protein n=1 Tax=Mycoplasma zalophidermidis TaxID=398174 RepID=UPI00215BA384|nr:hypothetical protein [Mycoplasma zalophidermidis]MCR8966455.1 hypothetical protein [Mycoplasma zalophidermidis]